MKKSVFTIAMVAALLAGTSCSKVNEINGVEEGVEIPDKILVGYDESMITKSFLASDNLSPQWDETDSFYLHGSNPTIWYNFESYPDPNDKTKALFKKVTTGSLPYGATAIKAIYGVKPGTTTGTSTLPDVHNYMGEGNISNIPMMNEIYLESETPMNNITFYPTAHILAVTVPSGLVKKISISSDNMPFSGQVSFSYSNQTGGIMVMNDATSTAGYEIVCNKGDGIVANNTTFYFPVASKKSGSLSVTVQGLKVKIIGKDDVIKVMTAKQDVVFAKGATKKCKIYSVTFKEDQAPS